MRKHEIKDIPEIKSFFLLLEAANPIKFVKQKSYPETQD